MSSDETQRGEALLWGANQQQPAQRRRATRQVLRHATDTEDAQTLLDMLGLGPRGDAG